MHESQKCSYALEARIVTENERGAVKGANEIRTRLIANNEWPEVRQ